jgi:hypothetical protein
MSQVEAPNSLRTWEFGDYAHYSEWPKVADAVIEAGSGMSGMTARWSGWMIAAPNI